MDFMHWPNSQCKCHLSFQSDLLVKISIYQKLNMMNVFKKPHLGYEIYHIYQMVQIMQNHM